MLIGEACNREVVVTTRDTVIVQAARLMREHHVGNLVVVEERDGQRFPVGIVTDRDIVVEVVAENVALDALTVGDIMSAELLTAQEEDSVWIVLERMRARGVRRIPVVNAKGVLVGIMAMDDLLGLLSEELASLARLIKSEQMHEARTRK
jgi:CBS domain-containing protein